MIFGDLVSSCYHGWTANTESEYKMHYYNELQAGFENFAS